MALQFGVGEVGHQRLLADRVHWDHVAAAPALRNRVVPDDGLARRTSAERGKDETKVAEKKVKATGKPAGGARGGITAPVTPSDELAEIVGKADLARSEVVKKVWDYIKKNDLQDAKDRRQINGDEKLQRIFGKKSASMFEMNKHLSAHLTAKKD